MEKFNREELVKEDKDINTYIDAALKTYAVMDFNKNEGLKEFNRVVTKSDEVSQINEADLKSFFNLRLAMEYIVDNNIDITHMNKEERTNVEREISSKILSNLRSGKEGYLVVKSGEVQDVEHTFVLNVANESLISLLSNVYSNAKKANVPLVMEINSDIKENHKDSLKVSCANKDLDATINILNSINGVNLLPPMNFIKNINNEVGYTNVSRDGKTVIEVVYESLIHALDDVIASVSLEPATSDLDRFQKIESIKSNDAKNMIVTKFKEYLTNSGLSLNSFGVFENKTIENNMDETVINVKKPEITFEENILNDENATPEITSEEIIPETPAFDVVEDIVPETPTVQEPLADVVQDVVPEVPTVQEPVVDVAQDIVPEAPITQEPVADVVQNAVPGAPVSQDELSDEDVQSILSNEETLERNNEPERIDVALKYKNVFPSIDVLNQKITYNGEEMTILDYLEMNDVLNKIAIDKTYVDLEGVKLLGSEFIRERIVPYAKEVENTSVDEIINIYGLKEFKKKEKGRFLGKLFK